MPATLRAGSSGLDVLRWQRLLAGAGHPVPETSVFDQPTTDHTRMWQASRGIAADGVVGPASWEAMTGEAAPKKNAPKSFVEMLDLILANMRRPNDPFSPELLMAIFWEESLFTNVRQSGGGTAIGFGQVEPAELGKITTERAKELGYYVDGVSTATRELDDALSVTVPSCYLLHLYHASSASTVEERVRFALNGYAGVYYEGPSPLTKEQRLAIVANWRECERALQALPFTSDGARRGASPDIEDAYMSALALARPFSAPSMRSRLFPAGWQETTPPGVETGRSTALPAALLVAGLGLGGLAGAEILRPGTLAAILRALRRLLARAGARVGLALLLLLPLVPP